jgi:hypothetical protein
MKTLLTFASIHYVLKAEKILKARGISTDMIPVPKEISSDCGMALLVEEGDLPSVKEALAENKISPQGVYPYFRPGEKN